MSSLQYLPPELYTAILSKIPIPLRQCTTLNLSRAIPNSPVPLHFLFECITITRSEQVLQLYRRLKFDSKDPDLECLWVKSFTLLEWNVDADVLVNTLTLCRSLNHLSLRVGPVFAPEHLEELFMRPFHSLTALNIRFRPYVRTATYYQFLKGSYFDSVFDCITNWELAGLKHLSITQDSLPPHNPNEKAFAQPIVFFSFAPLASLSVSLAMQAVTHLRLNIPSRRLVQCLIGSDFSSIFDIHAFPNLMLLDLSSCAVHAADLPALISGIGNAQLKHLILDNTQICNGDLMEWEALGKAIALADIAPNREREKLLRTWANSVPSMSAQNQSSNRGVDLARHKRGRRGVATATISLRERLAVGASVRPQSISPECIKKLGKLRIVPVVPRLQSLCINQVSNDAEDIARSEFAKGWLDGLRQLQATWTRLLQSQSNGVRLFRFDASRKCGPSSGLAGLVEIGRPGQDSFWDDLASPGSARPPLLCFAGAIGENISITEASKECRHPDECVHRTSTDIWPAGF